MPTLWDIGVGADISMKVIVGSKKPRFIRCSVGALLEGADKARAQLAHETQGCSLRTFYKSFRSHS
jgi:hypothetical protein